MLVTQKMRANQAILLTRIGLVSPRLCGTTAAVYSVFAYAAVFYSSLGQESDRARLH
jgi:hypothetical protein